jgi:UDP-glucose:(heptosyl)LPS alpha-1,3-glucosyltransferase
MKIALVIERMDVSSGGREVSTSQIAAGLARRGQEVAVLCQQGGWTHEGVRVEALGRRGLSRARRFLNFAADVNRWLLTHPRDVVHAVAPVPGATFYQPRGGTMPGQAESRLRRGGAQALKERLFGSCNAFRRTLGRLERDLAADPRVTCLAVSEMVAGEFRRHYGRREGLRVIYNGVDAPAVTSEERLAWRAKRRAELGIPDGAPLFLVIARNFGLKGVDETIEHFLHWRRTRKNTDDARLVIVGRAMTLPPHRSARVRQIARCIPMVAWTPDVFEWHSAADACILLSWYDACSRVVLEAVRWGLPCVTTRYNGAAETLAEGGGVVVDSPRDREGVLRAMDAMRDPDRRRAFSRACLRAGECLGMDRHVDQLLEAYAAARQAI